MKSGWRLWVWVGVVGICASRAFALDTGWTNELQTITFYRGDANGTVCQDMYTDQANPDVNYNGAGLNLRWFGSGQRPGYIRFDNWLSKIPAGSFIYRADLILTASSNSTGAGAVLMGALGSITYNETNATWNTMVPLPWYAQAPGAYWYDMNNQCKRAFGTNLLAGTSMTFNVSAAARAWFDYYQNPSWGYINAGVWMNTDAGGSGHAENAEYFYDSEDSTPANRPHLVVQYLPPTSNYKICLYQGVGADTAQIKNVTPQDDYIQACNWNAGLFGLTNRNFGGMMGPQLFLFTLDSYLTGSGQDVPGVSSKELFRWPGLSYPSGVHHHVADAKLRLNVSPTWEDGETGPAAVTVQKIMKNWVEGVGTYAAPSTQNVTWCNYDAAPGDTTLTTNAWQAHGASGPTDSTNLYTFNMGDQYGESLSSDAGGLLAALVQDWLDGVGPNNGVALTTDGLLYLQIGHFETGVQPYHLTDPYLTAGVLVVYKKPVGSGVMLK